MRSGGDSWQSSYSTSQRWRHYEYYDYFVRHLSFAASSFDDDFYRLENFAITLSLLWFLADTIIFDKSRQYKLVDPML